MTADFVNPYTFIPLPAAVVRREPPGHAPTADEAGTRYVGSFTVTWHLEAQMAVPTDEWGALGGTIRIPGSSVKGAVRSVHEALFGGCLRQVDLDFSPTYRDLPKPKGMIGWRMAVVLRPGWDDGPLRVLLCAEHDLPIPTVRARTLLHSPQLGGSIPQTGDLIEVGALADVRNGKGHLVRRRADTILGWTRAPQNPSHYEQHAGKYLLLVTSQGARKDNHDRHWAIAPLTEEIRTLSEDAVRKYQGRSVGAKESGTPGAGGLIDVKQGRDLLARRRPQAVDLVPGDVVWVQEDGVEVEDVRLSQIWRRRLGSDEAVRRRIPDATHPCADAELCLTCAVFGSADTHNEEFKPRRLKEGKQNSYAGHVRFGSAALMGPVGSTEALAPLAQPNLGSGVSYLQPQQNPPDPDGPDARLTHWERERGWRQLRGRKFYWHSDPEDQRRELEQRTNGRPVDYRYLKRNNHADNACSVALVLNPGQRFTQKVTFDGLDEIGLQTLLAAIEPRRVLDGEGPYALHLGRGKPLGLGSVRAEISGLQVTTVRDRYSRGDSRDALPSFEAVDVNLMRERCGPLSDAHQAARKILSLNGLGDNQWKVSYPTLAPWSAFGRVVDGRSAFDESFEFFKEHNGPADRPKEARHYRWTPGKWTPMPEARDADQRWGR